MYIEIFACIQVLNNNHVHIASLNVKQMIDSKRSEDTENLQRLKEFQINSYTSIHDFHR